ncbi:Stress responsive A/B Barrel Domain [uncultured Clostridium sp.]|uniref:Dabb family protein n=1 Tax=uncultured Clostridium sp. TaxID=59620 RepID=UPI0008231D95|nr:Dabb family protein [uncultured Clostridium sp.]SCJ32252.1 Stress responsive A/B Barrel Domain [uncultured Clostridium sp.]
MYTHIVFFKLVKPTNDNIELIKSTLLSMEGNISELRHLEVGIDDIRSDRSYDIALITKFDNKEDYISYDINEYHVEKVKKVIKPYIESSKTVDYIS